VSEERDERRDGRTGCATQREQVSQGASSMQNTMNTATLSPTSPKVKRRQSARIRQRTGSYLPPQQTQETHDAALYSIRTFLRSRTSYDAFPVSFRVIVLDSQLEVKKALQCLLLNGGYPCDVALGLDLTCPQVWFLPPSGTARNRSLLGCSPSLISSI
jgi:hypothetical protein